MGASHSKSEVCIVLKLYNISEQVMKGGLYSYPLNHALQAVVLSTAMGDSYLMSSP